MAAPPPLLLMAAAEKAKDRSTIHIQSDSTKPEPSSGNRGRKPSKGPPARRKPPQRGMGVAQLERLRIQEGLKKITETNQVDSFIRQPAPFSASDPIHSVPVQFGSLNCGLPLINGGGWFGFDQDIGVKGFENGGYEELNRNPSSVRFSMNPHVFGAPDMRARVGSHASAFETSKELSSMPKMIQHFDQTLCDTSCKKKKIINGRDFQGLNLGNKVDLNDPMGGFGARAARSAFNANNNNLSEGVEVVRIHMMANLRGGNGFMEYDFFPGKNNEGKSSTFFKETEFQNPAESSVAVGSGEASSCLTTSNYSGYTAPSNASNSVDLSLKLSY